MNYFIDTNIFLRAILGDHKTQSPKAQKLLTRIKTAANSYFTTSWVVAEIIWTLHSLYKFPKEKIIEVVEGIINTPNLSLLEEKLVTEALLLFKQKNIDFIDGINYLISRNKKADGIISFDKDFDKLALPHSKLKSRQLIERLVFSPKI